jgi:hypothetical protein
MSTKSHYIFQNFRKVVLLCDHPFYLEDGGTNVFLSNLVDPSAPLHTARIAQGHAQYLRMSAQDGPEKLK